MFGSGHRGVEELVTHSREKSNISWISRRKTWLETWVWEFICVNQARTWGTGQR